MKFSKKMMAALLAACMTAGALAGCGNEEGQGTAAPASGTETAGQDANGSGDASDGSADAADGGEASAEGIDWEEDPAEINWFIWAAGAGAPTQNAVDRIEEKINEKTLSTINVQVNLTIFEMGSYLTQMPMQITAGDQIDLITTFPAGSGNFTTMVSSGQLLPLDDLLADYCSDMTALVPDNFFDATTIKGEIYGAPIYTDYTNDLYWICRADILEEAGINVEDIKSYEDLPAVFDAVKAIHPELKMVSSGAQAVTGSVGLLLDGTQYDALTDIAAVFFDKDEEAYKVVNLFETEEYKKEAAIYREWYEAGYIDQDILIRETDPTADQTVFSWFLQGNNSRTIGNEQLAGGPLVRVKMGEGPVTTSSMAIMTMAIPVNAKEPEAAARLMNLLYTDADLKNLVNYGIEGEDYTLNEAGGVVQDTSAAYAPNTNGLFGNTFLSYLTESEVASGLTNEPVDQSSLPYSPLLGFSVNANAISNEVAQLSSVMEEYGKQVKSGIADEETYQAMIDKMHASGLDNYLAEIQSQLDEWLAEKN